MRELVNIIITTYNRLEICKQTIRGLKENLIYENLAWIIADDGSPDGYVDELVKEIGSDHCVQTTNAGRRGVGYSKNLALRKAFEESPIVLLLEDDWLLRQKLDISAHADLLMSNPNVGMIRYGWLSSDTLTADLVGDRSGYGSQCYWRLKKDSGQYVYSGQVSLRHQRLYTYLGYHHEGINAGLEELDMCGRYNTAENPPEILWPANLACNYQTSCFIDIGAGYSLNTLEPEVK